MVDELHEADGLDGLHNIEACLGSDDFYLYNKLYDVYFEYNSDDNVSLLKMNHPIAGAPTDAPPLRQ